VIVTRNPERYHSRFEYGTLPHRRVARDERAAVSPHSAERVRSLT
jgi:hypothetical protein